MTTEELITKQQLEIEELKNTENYLRNDLNEIISLIYAIGGPLNDNVLKYSKAQLDIFFTIGNIAARNECDDYNY